MAGGAGVAEAVARAAAMVMFLTVLTVWHSSRISLYWQCAPREGNDPQNGLWE
jgi:hypothetical protein